MPSACLARISHEKSMYNGDVVVKILACKLIR
jgi:hypothetical protein